MSDRVFDYEKKVVLVTGAGGVLGRSHALTFAARGARVLVNDLGGGAKGGGGDASVAELVVKDIKAAGGEAAANSDSVIDGGRIIENAMDVFGTIDIVVNNAGILRDASFHKMSDDDWRLIHDVHLQGAYAVTRAAWPILREKSYGRIVMTSSGAGLYGNFGQSNYASAKLALHGLAQSLAVEGRAKNIFVNTIAPVAGSRLTETVMPPDMVTALDPKLVTPLLLLLCHERSDTTGELFEVGGGWVSRIRWQRSQGVFFNPKETFSPEQLSEVWDGVQSFDNSDYPTELSESLRIIGKNIGLDLGLAPQK